MPNGAWCLPPSTGSRAELSSAQAQQLAIEPPFDLPSTGRRIAFGVDGPERDLVVLHRRSAARVPVAVAAAPLTGPRGHLPPPVPAACPGGPAPPPPPAGGGTRVPTPPPE